MLRGSEGSRETCVLARDREREIIAGAAGRNVRSDASRNVARLTFKLADANDDQPAETEWESDSIDSEIWVG